MSVSVCACVCVWGGGGVEGIAHSGSYNTVVLSYHNIHVTEALVAIGAVSMTCIDSEQYSGKFFFGSNFRCFCG